MSAGECRPTAGTNPHVMDKIEESDNKVSHGRRCGHARPSGVVKIVDVA